VVVEVERPRPRLAASLREGVCAPRRRRTNAIVNAIFEIGGETCEVFGPRARDITTDLELREVNDELVAKIVDQIEDDGKPAEPIVLDDVEQRQVLEVLDRLAAASTSLADDLGRLRELLRARV